VENLQAILKEALETVAESSDTQSLDQVRVKYLGKKGEITQLLKGLGKLSADERPQAGATINAAKVAVQDAINVKKEALVQAALAEQLSSESIDVTLPGRGDQTGGLHPITRTLERIESFFSKFGLRFSRKAFLPSCPSSVM